MLRKLSGAAAVAAMLLTLMPDSSYARMGGFGGGAARGFSGGGAHFSGMGARGFSGMGARSFSGAGVRSFSGVGVRSFSGAGVRSFSGVRTMGAGRAFAGAGFRHHRHFRGAPFLAGAVGLGLGLGYYDAGYYDAGVYGAYDDGCLQLVQTAWGLVQVNACNGYAPY
jgi:hypothetical protein